MSEDDLYLMICYLVQLITMFVLIGRSKNRKKSALINIGFFLSYNILFHYNLIYNSSGGSGLVWLVYLMFSLGSHWLINIIGIIKTIITK
jgi:hypothetical protein